MTTQPCGHGLEQVCDRCVYSLAQALAASQQRELTHTELNHIFSAAVARADYVDAQKVLDIFGGRDFTADELERMLAACIHRGSYDLASHAAKMAGRPLAQIEKDRVAIIGLRVHNDTNQAMQMALWGLLSSEAIMILIDVAMEKSLRQTATFLREQLATLKAMATTATTTAGGDDEGEGQKALA